MEQPNFKIRPWERSDLDSLVKYANNWSVAKNMTELTVFLQGHLRQTLALKRSCKKTALCWKAGLKTYS